VTEFIEASLLVLQAKLTGIAQVFRDSRAEQF
jgi:hypothetical protein